MANRSGWMWIAFGIGTVLYGCTAGDTTLNRIQRDLERATTAAEERDVFLELNRRSAVCIGRITYLGFTPYDTKGNVVDMSKDNWWLDVEAIVLEFDGRRIRHRLLDPSNLDVLMWE